MMCGCYYVDHNMLDEIQQVVKEIDNRLQKENYAGDVFPKNCAPVLESADRGMRLTKIRWGYPGIQGKGVIINARAESVQEKRMFQNGIRRHRIIIPASAFYEWNKNKEKFTFQKKESGLLFMAGFADLFEQEQRFVILTTEANESVRKVHDRMPLLLEEEQLGQWVKEDLSVKEILRQTPVLLSSFAQFEQQTLF